MNTHAVLPAQNPGDATALLAYRLSHR